MTSPGAPAALHGYRVQALHSLKRILTQSDSGYVFHPEGMEDLDIYSGDGQILELLQVKKYAPLRLSDLSPEKIDGFFRRALKHIGPTCPKISVVNFGQIGPELRRAWCGDETAMNQISRRFAKHGYTDEEIAAIFDSVEFIEADETTQELEVFALLRELQTGADPRSAFELLHFWMFLCMERQHTIDYPAVVKKLTSVGRYLAARRDHNLLWNTVIQPIETSSNIEHRRESLRDTFYAGGFTTYDHIACGFDFPREDKLTGIHDAFSKSNVVIIHAASGQGKTTLALRYIHDRFPDGWKFSIERVADVQTALAAANALQGFAAALEAPVAVYIDVHPNDTDWIELASQLARHQHIHVLVTLREEDYRRSVSSEPDFAEEISLAFSEDEARFIFDQADSAIVSQRFLDFDAAWDAFRDDGPLLEFVFLLTQSETLQQRLAQQVHRIRTEVRDKQLEPDELQLLRLISVATAYEARISTRQLLNSLNLPEPDTTLKLFEKEFLIRTSESGYIDGLHSIRSQNLVELLTDQDVNLWVDLAAQVLPMVLEDDIEQFLLYTAIDRADEFVQLQGEILALRPSTWRGLAGVLRSLLWFDMKSYVEASREMIAAAKEEFGAGWAFILNLEPANDDVPHVDRWWQSESLASLFTPERIERLNEIRDMQPTKENMYISAGSWFKNTSTPMQEPENLRDWHGVAFALYWAADLNVEQFLVPAIDCALPLSVMADVTYALYWYDPESLLTWQQQNHSLINSRLADEFGVLYLQSDGKLLTTFFLADESKIGHADSSDPLHAATIERLQLVRQIFPDYDRYGSQGYGHKLGDVLKLEHDSTYRPGIERQYLPPSISVWANRVTTNIARYQLRHDDWQQYVAKLMDTRRHTLTCLNQLMCGLQAQVSDRNPIDIGADYVDTHNWREWEHLLSRRPELPKPAVDPWGFASETEDRSTDGVEPDSAMKNNGLVPKAIAAQKYEKFLKTQREWLSSLTAFSRQAVDVLAINLNFIRSPSELERKAIEGLLEESGVHLNSVHLSTHNLWDSKRRLTAYQVRFRDLFANLAGIELAELEMEEQKCLGTTWLMWHQFAHRPFQTLANPLDNVCHNAANQKKMVDREIRRALTRFSNRNRSAKRLYSELRWEDASTLFLQLDINDPTDLHQAFNALIENLHSQFHGLGHEDLKRYLIRENYEKTIVIPTFRGRTANSNAWVLYTLSTILDSRPIDEHDPISYPMHPLPAHWFDDFGFSMWNLPQTKIADNVHTSFIGLTILASQVSELVNLSEANDEAGELLALHADRYSQTISENLQTFIDGITEITASWNQLDRREQTRRQYLQEALAVIINVMDVITLSDEETIKYHLDLEAMAGYSKKLASVVDAVEWLRLLLIADAISAQ